jgi:hypothetical protein
VLGVTVNVQTFEIFAEISVALLGFSGLVAVLGNATQRAFFSTRIRGLLFSSGAAVICSVAPLAKLDLVYCAFLYIGLVIAMQAWAITGLMRSEGARPSWAIYVALLTLSLTAVSGLLYGVFLNTEILHTAYLFGLCVQLFTAAIFFIRLVLATTTEIEDT